MKTIKKSHAVCSIGYHLIWCTKYRHPVLTGNIEIELKQIFAETCKHYGWLLTAIEVMPDHVHLFVQSDHLVSPIAIVSALKSISAIQIFTLFPALKGQKFWGSGLWSKGTYYSTVGHISEKVVRKYIENQKQK